MMSQEKSPTIDDLADYPVKKDEGPLSTKDIQQLVIKGNAFNFLNEDEDFYSLADLKERHNC